MKRSGAITRIPPLMPLPRRPQQNRSGRHSAHSGSLFHPSPPSILLNFRRKFHVGNLGRTESVGLDVWAVTLSLCSFICSTLDFTRRRAAPSAPFRNQDHLRRRWHLSDLTDRDSPLSRVPSVVILFMIMSRLFIIS